MTASVLGEWILSGSSDHFQLHAFQESKVGFASLVLKGFRWEALTMSLLFSQFPNFIKTNCFFLSLVIYKGDSIFPGKYQEGEEKVKVI